MGDELRRVAQVQLSARTTSSDSVASRFAADLAHALRAQEEWQRGRPRNALEAAARIRSEAPLERIANSPFYAHLPERFVRAEALRALGRDVEAVGFYTSLEEGRFDAIYLAPTHLRLAELAERAGNRRAAALHYARVVELWDQADPELREVVGRVRGRLEALARE